MTEFGWIIPIVKMYSGILQILMLYSFTPTHNPFGFPFTPPSLHTLLTLGCTVLPSRQTSAPVTQSAGPALHLPIPRDVRCPHDVRVVPHNVGDVRCLRDVRCSHDVVMADVRKVSVLSDVRTMSRAMSVLSAPRPPETEPRAGEWAEREPRRRRVSDTSRTPRLTSITLSHRAKLALLCHPLIRKPEYLYLFPDDFPCFFGRILGIANEN